MSTGLGGVCAMRWVCPLLVAGLLLTPPGRGQLLAAREGPVAMGHHHLFTAELEEQRRFWIEGLGAEPTRLGPLEVMKLPNLLVLLREQTPGGGTRGSSVDHVGVQVPDVRRMVARLAELGFPIVTRQEVPPADGDVFYVENQDTHIAFVMAPDGVKVELLENPTLPHPVANHHIHFFTTDVAATRAWYVETFGAVPGRRGSFEAADLPGVNLTFSASEGESAGTRGRALDHIGFEVEDLEGLCRRLEAKGVSFDRPYREIEALGLGIAFLTDPWGTYIELTEGLDQL